MAQERPGIMVYFDDVLPSLQCLTIEDAGRLFIAMLQYGRDGTPPNFGDSAGLNIAWNFIRPKIDRDNANYDKAVLKSRYGVYKREAGKRGEAPLGFDEWYQTLQSASSAHQSPNMPPICPIMGAYPTATSNKQLETQPQLEPAAGKGSTKVAPPASVPGSKAIEKRFAEFWSAYPKKVGKTVALKAWERICPNAELHKVILEAIAQQKCGAQWQRENGRFIPNPATWLNQGRWVDEIESFPGPSPPPAPRGQYKTVVIDGEEVDVPV